MPTPLFVSYSHRDSTEQEELCGHLKVLPGVSMDVWSDRRIAPGADWFAEIDAAMRQARVALLLVTKDFLNSEFIRTNEIPALLSRQQSGLTIVPVIARACSWRLTWLGPLQALPRDGVPVWSDDPKQRSDAALTAVAEAIHTLVSGEGSAARSAPDPIVAPIASATLADFTEDLRGARHRIDVVSYFKDLHDELHTLHTRCYRPLVDNLRWFPDDESVRTSFFEIESDLETTVAELQRIRAAAPPGVPAATWISLLEDAARQLSTANANTAVDALQVAVARLRQVLTTVPGRLDSSLGAAAGTLDIRRLRGALRTAIDRSPEGAPDAAVAANLQRMLDTLTAIEPTWTTLVTEHADWEDVENVLRNLDESLRSSGGATRVTGALDDLRLEFPYLTDQIAKLVTSGPSDALERIAATHRKLSDALARDDEPGVRAHYVAFRSMAGRRFENLDKQLKDLCRSMVPIGDDLLRLTATR